MATCALDNYEKARDWLYSLKNRGSSYGLERMELLAEAMENPQYSYPVIHVAGTNGKGSVCAMIEAAFRANGFRSGLFTSPHLVRQGERIQVDREILHEDRVLEYARAIKAVGEGIAATDSELFPSFFEFMTAMAFLHFQKKAVDIGIFEVGLGGRLDATNVVNPEVCVITSIGDDHAEILGDTPRKIALEKAGIVKPGIPVVVGWLEEEAMRAVEEVCAERGSELISVRSRFGDDLSSYPISDLNGGFQRINMATALTVCSLLEKRFSLDLRRCENAARKVDWPGRWEIRKLSTRDLIFDVSHNSEGAKWLEENLAKLVAESGAKPDIVVGAMGGYRARALAPVVAKWAHSIHVVVPAQSRACSHEELESFIPETFDGEIVRTTVSTLFPSQGKCVMDTLDTRPIVLTGSIYLVGEALECFDEKAPLGQGILQDF